MLVKTHLLPVLTLVILGAGPAHASEELVKKNGCATCHTLERKSIGPAWKEVAAKYKGDAKAAEDLAERVKAGGKGVWGQTPMPPQNKVSDADLKLMLAWVLAQ